MGIGTGLLGLWRSTGATSRPPIVRPSRPRIVWPSSKPAAITATQKEPTVVATSSSHQKLLGAPVPQPSKGAANASQLDANDDDGDDVDVEGYLNTGASMDMYMPPMDEEPFRAQGDQAARPSTCTQRLDFQGLSQDTPPEAGDQPPRKLPSTWSDPLYTVYAATKA